uniref:Putative secreted protein n=1 Tax=Anopheles triannulatus TaxID=58253 RepID=A0A2M4B335_9DIPT
MFFWRRFMFSAVGGSPAPWAFASLVDDVDGGFTVVVASADASLDMVPSPSDVESDPVVVVSSVVVLLSVRDTSETVSPALLFASGC